MSKKKKIAEYTKNNDEEDKKTESLNIKFIVENIIHAA